MISMKELLRGADFDSQPQNIQDNLNELLNKLNQVRSLYNKSMIVSSGLRTMADNIRIYKEKAAKAKVPFDISKVPTKNAHLSGSAGDISDPSKKLQKWCKDNEQSLIDIGLWMEDLGSTPTWVHFQTYPPKSGNRWFKP